MEEVIIQQVADFEEQIRVDPFAAEDFVGVLPRVAQLPRQPGDAAPLPCQFLLDEFAYMRFFIHAVCLSWSLARWANKMGGTIIAYLS